MDTARLKRDVSLVSLARELGLELVERSGRVWARCPWHGEDKDASLELDEARGLWHCFGCPRGREGGDVITLVQRAKQADFKQAVRFLEKWLGAGRGGGNGGNGAKRPGEGGRNGNGTHRKAQDRRSEGEATQDTPGNGDGGIGNGDGGIRNGEVGVVDFEEGIPRDAEAEVRRSRLLGRTGELYQKGLFRSAKARHYLTLRGLHDGALVQRFGIGYADGTLPRKLPRDSKIREELQQLGILNPKGNECFYLCITVPLRDEQGHVVGLYGRSIAGARHHYLPGTRRGLVNGEAAKLHPSLIVTEKIIDALTLFRAGFPNVLPLYGTQGFTPDHRAALAAGLVEQVLLVLDNDDAGRAAVPVIGGEIAALGKIVAVVTLPEGVKDINDYFVKSGGTREGFQDLLAQARELSSPAASLSLPAASLSAAEPTPALATPTNGTSPIAATPPATETSPSSPPSPSPAPPPFSSAAPLSQAAPQTSLPAASLPPRPEELLSFDEREVLVKLGEITYRVRGRPKGGRDFGALKVTVTARSEGGAHIDRIDLVQHGARRRFARESGAELGEQPKAIERDLVRVAEILEWVAGEDERAVKEKADAAAKPREMSEAERAEARALLEAPDLLARIVSTLDALGYVGEERNKLVTFLVAVSRLLDHPLACVFCSASGSGKSKLMELVCELVPEEDVKLLSRVTPAALYYLETGLVHKLLAIDERGGSEEADYSIRSLQTRGSLTLWVATKDPATGATLTREIHIEGPVAYMESTTRERLNPENENRCYQLHMDESEAQTARILEAQRRAAERGGTASREERDALVRAWRNAQRLLERLRVEIPYAGLLTYPTRWVRVRRDHERLLGLVAASALLHQRQREIRRSPAGVPEAVVASVEDYRVAYELTREAVALALDDATKPALDLLRTIRERAALIAAKSGIEPADVTFTRRELREWARRPDRTVRRLLEELVELEYVTVASGRNGQVMQYRLNPDASLPEAEEGEKGGLMSPEELRQRIGESAS